MTKRLSKKLIWAAELIGMFAAAIAACLVFVIWRAQSGPVAINLARPAAELLIDAQLSSTLDSSVGQIHLYKDNDTKGLSLVISDVAIHNDERTRIGYAERIILSASVSDLVGDRKGPRTVLVEGTQLHILRNREKKIAVPKVFGVDAAPTKSKSKEKKKNKKPFRFPSETLAFENAEIRNATVTFEDVASERSWESKNATIIVNRSDTGLTATLDGKISMGEKMAGLAVAANYVSDEEQIAVSFDGDNFPLSDLLVMFFGEKAGILDAPVSGKANVTFSTTGAVKAAKLDAHIAEGFLRLAGGAAPIKSIDWSAGFEPETQEFAIDHLNYDIGGNRGAITGTVNLLPKSTARALERVQFALKANDITLDLPKTFQAPIPIETAEFNGQYDIGTRKLNLSDLSIAAVDVVFGGELAFMASRKDAEGKTLSPYVQAALNVEGPLDRARLLKIWPPRLGAGARDWVRDRLATATIRNIKAVIELPAGALGAGGQIPNEAIDVTFDVDNGKAFYIPGTTPITNSAGQGHLRGNSFFLNVTQGNVGKVTINSGEVEFPTFYPKHQESFIRVNAQGASQDILGVLDEPPLSLLSKTNLSPSQFIGDATVTAEIMRPNKRFARPDEYEYRGKAEFENLRAEEIFKTATLTEGSGTLLLQPRFMVVETNAQLFDRQTDIVWRKNFFQEDGPSSTKVSGTMDASIGDLFGLPARRFVHGPFTYDLDLTGEIGDWKNATIDFDFAEAALTLEMLDWRKPAQSPAAGQVDIKFTDSALNVPKITIKGEEINVDAGFSFQPNGSIGAVDIREFWLRNAADFSATLSRDDAQQISVNILGRHLKAGPLIDAFASAERAPSPAKADTDKTTNSENKITGTQNVNTAPANNKANPWGGGLKMTGRIDLLELRNGVRYNTAALDVWRTPKRLEMLNFTAFGDQTNTPLTIKLSQSGDDTNQREQIIDVESGDVGAFVDGIFGWGALAGGEGALSFISSEGDPAVKGEINAGGVTVNDVPLLAKLFSAGSFQGLTSLMNGEGILLTEIKGGFALANDAIALNEFRASGPSIGLTANGSIPTDDDTAIALNGAIAPLYQVNSLLGSTPLIGDILVGRKGEGVFALSYAVSGDRDAPTVTVNPFSALTPGVIRQIFEGGGGADQQEPGAKAAQDPVDAPEVSSTDN